MWNKVKKSRSVSGMKSRTEFGVTRVRTGARGAVLIIPHGKTTMPTADVYSDGNGKLAFRPCENGDFKIFKPSPAAQSRRITIPAQHAEKIPYGTHDVTVTQDGDMWVLNTSQLAE